MSKGFGSLTSRKYKEKQVEVQYNPNGNQHFYILFKKFITGLSSRFLEVLKWSLTRAQKLGPAEINKIIKFNFFFSTFFNFSNPSLFNINHHIFNYFFFLKWTLIDVTRGNPCRWPCGLICVYVIITIVALWQTIHHLGYVQHKTNALQLHTP